MFLISNLKTFLKKRDKSLPYTYEFTFSGRQTTFQIKMVSMNSKSFFRLVQENREKILAASVTAFQSLLEYAIEINLFTCPCDSKLINKTSNFWILLGIPCALFLLLGFSININFWNLLKYCSCEKKTCEWQRTWTYYTADCCPCPKRQWLAVFLYALIFPTMWVLFVFVDGRYYACTFTTNPYILPKNRSCSQVSSFGVGFNLA